MAHTGGIVKSLPVAFMVCGILILPLSPPSAIVSGTYHKHDLHASPYYHGPKLVSFSGIHGSNTPTSGRWCIEGILSE